MRKYHPKNIHAFLLITTVLLLNGVASQEELVNSVSLTSTSVLTGVYLIKGSNSNTTFKVQEENNSQEQSDQKFFLKYIGDDIYYIVALDSGKALEVQAGGDEIVAAVFTGEEKQKWHVISDGVSLSIQSVTTGVFLHVTSSTQETQEDTVETNLILEQVLEEGVYHIRTKSSGKTLTAYQGKEIPVLIENPAAGTNQAFYLKKFSSNETSFTIININNYKALTASGLDTFEVNETTYSGYSNQNWEITPNGDNSFSLRSVLNGEMVGICNNSIEDGAALCVDNSLEKTDFTFELLLDLPLKRFNEMAYLTAHNSFASVEAGYFWANQFSSLSNQLESGVRGLMLDIWYAEATEIKNQSIFEGESGIYLLHEKDEFSPWVPGGTYSSAKLQRLNSTLQEVVTFLNKNPSEIISIFFEDYTTTAQLVEEMSKVEGLKELIYDPDNDLLLNAQEKKLWPRLSDMIHCNKRLLLWTDEDHANEVEKHGVAALSRYVKVNYWSLGRGGRDYECYPITESGLYPTNDTYYAPPLFLMNHYRDIPTTLTSSTDNIYENIWTRITHQCMEAANQYPNFLAVDMFQVSSNEPMLVVKKLNDPNTPPPTRPTTCLREYPRSSGDFTDECSPGKEKNDKWCFSEHQSGNTTEECAPGYSENDSTCSGNMCPEGYLECGKYCIKNLDECPSMWEKLFIQLPPPICNLG